VLDAKTGDRGRPFASAVQNGVFSGNGRPSLRFAEGGFPMLGWSILFLIVALIAAVFGFGGIAAAATDIARLLFVVFLVLFVISLLLGWRSTSPPL
jgi:uncharacterized membrane protein YtjA (UPF0391 family)